MGIKDLARLIGDKAPAAITEHPIKAYFGRTVAIDTSMWIYQFIIAMKGAGDDAYGEMVNAEGECTSHLNGLFFRTIGMVNAGIRPVFVFDGEAPDFKKEILKERREKAADAIASAAAAAEAGDKEAEVKAQRRSVRMTSTHIDQCRTLLKLLGMPVVDAPGEAEAQCAALAREGLVWGVGTEDMDALTFGTPTLLRKLSAPESKKTNIVQIELATALAGLKLTMDQFVDLCILLGCDYCGRIPGVGMIRAYELIKKHNNIEGVLRNIDKSKHALPDPYPYEAVRALFHKPRVLSKEEIPSLKQKPVDMDGLVEFMCGTHGFSKERVVRQVEKLQAASKKAPQTRLEGFLKRAPLPTAGGSGGAVSTKGAKGAATVVGASTTTKRAPSPQRSSSPKRSASLSKPKQSNEGEEASTTAAAGGGGVTDSPKKRGRHSQNGGSSGGSSRSSSSSSSRSSSASGSSSSASSASSKASTKVKLEGSSGVKVEGRVGVKLEAPSSSSLRKTKKVKKDPLDDTESDSGRSHSSTPADRGVVKEEEGGSVVKSEEVEASGSRKGSVSPKRSASMLADNEVGSDGEASAKSPKKSSGRSTNTSAAESGASRATTSSAPPAKKATPTPSRYRKTRKW